MFSHRGQTVWPNGWLFWHDDTMFCHDGMLVWPNRYEITQHWMDVGEFSWIGIHEVTWLYPFILSILWRKKMLKFQAFWLFK
jgi:hypothetical protein